MADAAAKQIVKMSAEIVLGSDPFENAPVLTAIGAATKQAQEQIAASGGEATAGFKFAVSVEAEKPARKPRQAATPPASPPPPPAGNNGEGGKK